ncbi:MAG TPA: hypothetical protein VFF69_07175 [Phycisphaerales bacterium]|nr:hypothetical protein [Phycisphaerales bacterium]
MLERNSSMPPLLDDEAAVAGVARPRRPGARVRLNDLWSRVVAGAGALWTRRLVKRVFMAVSSVGAVALGLSVYLLVRPVPKPDYENADISRVFDYTLLTDEFNALPVEERVALIGQLYERIRGMDSSESVLMAQFFAGVAGQAREQIEKNATKLFMDAADMVAQDYAAVPEEEKGAYLEQSLVRLIRLGQAFDPELAERTDEEIVAQAREDAQRDHEALRDGELSADQGSRMLVFMGMRMDKNASMHQRQRVNLFMRDMVRHLRSGG